MLASAVNTQIATSLASRAHLVSPARIERYQAQLQRLIADPSVLDLKRGSPTERLAEFAGRVEMLRHEYILAGSGKLRGTKAAPGTGDGPTGIDRVYRHIDDPTNLAVVESKYRDVWGPGRNPLLELGRPGIGTQMSKRWLTNRIDAMSRGPHGPRVNQLGEDLLTYGYGGGRYMNVLDGSGRSYFYDLSAWGLK